MDPKRGDYALVNGEDYRKRPLDAGWVLERFPPRSADVTLAELAVTVALLGALGLAAGGFGLSAIPAYLLAGLLLGPNEPEQLAHRPAVRR